jgi:ketosteroid isomerase-like protein
MNPRDFADSWESDWNSHDLDAIMSHYRDDVVFRSRKAIPLVGHGEIVGKIALRAYWAAALERQPDLKFRVQEVFVGYKMLAISYLNHCDILAVETLYFDQNNMVYKAAACHKLE